MKSEYPPRTYIDYNTLEQLLVAIFLNIQTKSSNGPGQLVVRKRYHPSKVSVVLVRDKSSARTRIRGSLRKPPEASAP